jgi:hypothetical protein
MLSPEEQRRQLEAAIAGLEAQRALLGDAVALPALAALRQQLDDLALPPARSPAPPAAPRPVAGG